MTKSIIGTKEEVNSQIAEFISEGHEITAIVLENISDNQLNNPQEFIINISLEYETTIKGALTN